MKNEEKSGVNITANAPPSMKISHVSCHNAFQEKIGESLVCWVRREHTEMVHGSVSSAVVRKTVLPVTVVTKLSSKS
jgi:hypothetical protein